MTGSIRLERAQPWLGTLVKIGADGADGQAANAAIDAAFAEVALVHRLMSFHEPDSDVSAINRGTPSRPIRVHPHTARVLRIALEISRASDGIFDITVAPLLVARGLLPRPQSRPADDRSRWQDLELIEPDQVCLRRSLWIDLGGIAKGYAVDLATRTLLERTTGECYVNAGGDLRVARGEPRRILLNVPNHPRELLPAIEVDATSVASSAAPPLSGPHIEGRSRADVVAGKFATVLAERCVIADALTKVALSTSAARAAVLDHFNATALVFHPDDGWLTLGRNVEAPCPA